ncbi:MAG: helix-turn-helix domain-containing protein [Bacilli bacterium]|nr:helix-turn-helix domain-containing protein [Bacilli bacterium]
MSKNHGKLYYDLLDDNLSKSTIVFFTLLLSNSNQKGYAFGSNKYYAEKLKCSTRTISTLIRTLVNKGYISVENPKSFRRKIYIRSKFLT